MVAQQQLAPEDPRNSTDSVGQSLVTLFNGFFGHDVRTTGTTVGGSSPSRSPMNGQGFGDTRGRSNTKPWSPEQRSQDVMRGAAAKGKPFCGKPQTNPNMSPYVVDKEDLLDQHVGYYLRHHPEVHARHRLVRKRPKVYELDGREIRVDWQYATEPGGQGFLVVIDGPLRQPFADYMSMSEENAEYETQTLGMNSGALHLIPKEQRVSFHDQHKVYSRLEAMKVAKEQAVFRERAADLVKDGREVPPDLMIKYKKTIDQKLGRRQRHGVPKELPQPMAPKASRECVEHGHRSDPSAYARRPGAGWPTYSPPPVLERFAGSGYPTWSGALTSPNLAGLTPPNLFRQGMSSTGCGNNAWAHGPQPLPYPSGSAINASQPPRQW